MEKITQVTAVRGDRLSGFVRLSAMLCLRTSDNVDQKAKPAQTPGRLLDLFSPLKERHGDGKDVGEAEEDCRRAGKGIEGGSSTQVDEPQNWGERGEETVGGSVQSMPRSSLLAPPLTADEDGGNDEGKEGHLMEAIHSAPHTGQR